MTPVAALEGTPVFITRDVRECRPAGRGHESRQTDPCVETASLAVPAVAPASPPANDRAHEQAAKPCTREAPEEAESESGGCTPSAAADDDDGEGAVSGTVVEASDVVPDSMVNECSRSCTEGSAVLADARELLRELAGIRPQLHMEGACRGVTVQPACPRS